MGSYLLRTSITTETITRRMSVTGILLTPLLLVALCSAAPYEVQSTTSVPAVGAPEKLVDAVRSVHCSVQYVTIWDTKYEEQPFEVCETVYQQLCEVKSQRLCQNTTLAPVDIINRNDESTFAFSNDNSVEAENTNVQEFDKFVFENNSNVNFEE